MNQNERETMKEERAARNEMRAKNAEKREENQEARDLRRLEREMERERREIERVQCERETQQLERHRQVRERSREARDILSEQRSQLAQQRQLEQDARRFLTQFQELEINRLQGEPSQQEDSVLPRLPSEIHEQLMQNIRDSQKSRQLQHAPEQKRLKSLGVGAGHLDAKDAISAAARQEAVLDLQLKRELRAQRDANERQNADAEDAHTMSYRRLQPLSKEGQTLEEAELTRLEDFQKQLEEAG